MTNHELQTPEARAVEVKVSDEARLSVIKTQLDRLFRQAGNGAEARVLYRAVLDYRMDNPK